MSKTKNPKIHDSLFKWAIASLTMDFFESFFSKVKLSTYEIVDKEFVAKFEPFKASIEADLFLVVTAVINGKEWDIIIVIELKSSRDHVMEQLRQYICYASLLRNKPVWPIVLFSDDATWKKPIKEEIPFAFHSELGLIHIPYDMIKLSEYKSATLIQSRSLLLKLFALKGNDEGCQREDLVREIYKTLAERPNQYTNDHILLAERFIQQYSKVNRKKVEKIKKEAEMTIVASTITEYHELLGEERGEARGEARGKLQGQIQLWEQLRDRGMITQEQFEVEVRSLRQQLMKIDRKDQL